MVTNPFEHVSGHLLGTLLGAPEWMKLVICQIGGFFMLGGLIVMGKGWKQIHAAKGQLVTDGMYAKVRHPQYLRLFLVTVGMLIQSPTLLTIAMWPILMVVYYRLARREEGEMVRQFGEEYREYMAVTPAFVPLLERRKR